MASRSLIGGRGINDAEYPTQRNTEGGSWACPYYTAWRRIIKSDADVDEQWLRFSAFRAWMVRFDWKDKQLDPWLLGDGKTYGPETCCYLERSVGNTVKALRTDNITGVARVREATPNRRWRVSSYNKHVGYFKTEDAALKAWRKSKNLHIKSKLKNYQGEVRKALTELIRAD